ncbi:WD40-repeat-containing domain protein [Mucor mucedo]|uniref:WD40-repeat-containing domain protein n=1 Tax=Mucor mucedo TaxID=29922 RepID=UPI002220F9C9|nr:WD40-repeat-containing domain protein [Mucor mucedo]KAI7873289.1 WD40-repeat-containing domain protein [Mucor mucedo]
MNVEFKFGTSDRMDVYALRRNQQEIMSAKKPRSLLYNIADRHMDRGMSELMIATSLDGELQFWNSVDRKKIKTIGKDHLYDSWIDDICWATPSTLAFCPSSKLLEPVKLIHICNVTKTNVEGRIQTLRGTPHENGVSVIASMDTGTYSSSYSEACSIVTGGYDKSVYLWGLKRESPLDNFLETGVHRLNIKHTSAVYSLHYDKFRNVLFSGGSDERLVLFDIQSNSTIRELRLQQRVSQINQSKANPNIMLITTTNRTDQFLIYDQRVPGFDGVKLKFGQFEQETLSRFIKPDMHENGYMVCCGGQGAPKLNFWDLRYSGVSRGPSFTMDTQAMRRSLRSMFLPGQDTVVSVSSSRYMTWIDYAVAKDELPQNIV